MLDNENNEIIGRIDITRLNIHSYRKIMFAFFSIRLLGGNVSVFPIVLDLASIWQDKSLNSLQNLEKKN